MSSVVIPPGQAPPLAIITATDHSGWVIIGTAFSLSLALLSGGIRYFIRRVISPPFGYDDISIGVATAALVIQSSVVFHSISQGLGKSGELLSTEQLVHIGKCAYVSDIFFVLAVWLSKCSVIYFLLRLTPNKVHTRIFNGFIGAMTVWLVLSIFLVTLRCNLSHPWIVIGESCPGLLARWQVIGVLNIVTELIVFSGSIFLIWGLRVSFSKKAAIVIAFGIRLPIIIVIVFRIHTFNRALHANNLVLAQAPYVIWTQVEVAYAVMSATLICLRSLVSSLNTNYGAFDRNTTTNAYGSYGSGKFNSKKSRKQSDTELASIPTQNREPGSEPQLFTGPSSDYVVHASNGRPTAETAKPDKRITGMGQAVHQDSNSIESNDSRQRIIKKVEWRVDYDGQPSIESRMDPTSE
ncbi:hypothetical protein MMC06_006084, partial [Schaereria dolodes]|nr:hypothetical protein [Schaereria dolodes]